MEKCFGFDVEKIENTMESKLLPKNLLSENIKNCSMKQ